MRKNKNESRLSKAAGMLLDINLSGMEITEKDVNAIAKKFKVKAHLLKDTVDFLNHDLAKNDESI